MHSVINELKSTTSINDKIKILQKYKDNMLLQRILKLTYDKQFVFGIKKIPEVKIHKNNITLEKALDIIEEKLVHEKLRGNSAIKLVEKLLMLLSEEDAKILELILKKDLKCGINIKLINKVFPNLIYIPKYMGAIPFNRKKLEKLINSREYILGQIKYDGEYIALKKINNRIVTETRNGKLAYIEDIFADINIPDNHVLMGELLVRDFNRYLANGALNSYRTIKQKIEDNINVSKEIKQFEKRYNITIEEFSNRIYYVVWDILPYEEYINENTNTNYIDRMKKVYQLYKDNNRIIPAETKILKNIDEVFKYFKYALKRGEEGIIIKDPYIKFYNKKPNEIIKVKPEFTCDMKIIGYLYGNKNTKYEKYINKLQVVSEDGLVSAQISGMTEDDMKILTKMKDNLIGKIVEVKATALSQDSNGNYGLLHPSFVRLRDDKDTADTFEDIKNNFEMQLLKKEVHS